MAWLLLPAIGTVTLVLFRTSRSWVFYADEGVVSCSLAAYAFARLRFRMRGPNKPGMVDTYWPLILPKFLATEAFFVFLIVQFVRGLPRELDEAARIDGCGPMFAMSVISVVPIVLFFFALQRYLVQGMATSGLCVAFLWMLPLLALLLPGPLAFAITAVELRIEPPVDTDSDG